MGVFTDPAVARKAALDWANEMIVLYEGQPVVRLLPGEPDSESCTLARTLRYAIGTSNVVVGATVAYIKGNRHSLPYEVEDFVRLFDGCTYPDLIAARTSTAFNTVALPGTEAFVPYSERTPAKHPGGYIGEQTHLFDADTDPVDAAG